MPHEIADAVMAEPKVAAPTLHENLLALAEQVANHADALNRVGQRLSDAEHRIEVLLREVGKEAPR